MSSKKVEQYKKEKYHSGMSMDSERAKEICGIIIGILLAALSIWLVADKIYTDNKAKLVADIDSEKLYTALENVLNANTEDDSEDADADSSDTDETDADSTDEDTDSTDEDADKTDADSKDDESTDSKDTDTKSSDSQDSKSEE